MVYYVNMEVTLIRDKLFLELRSVCKKRTLIFNTKVGTVSLTFFVPKNDAHRLLYQRHLRHPAGNDETSLLERMIWLSKVVSRNKTKDVEKLFSSRFSNFSVNLRITWVLSCLLVPLNKLPTNYYPTSQHTLIRASVQFVWALQKLTDLSIPPRRQIITGI